MVTPPETFTDVLSTLYIVCREGKKKERAEGLILHSYQAKNFENGKNVKILFLNQLHSYEKVTKLQKARRPALGSFC